MPEISVIMGVYNLRSKEMTKSAIDSILNQTYTDFEFIICDDGSDNDTRRMVEDLTKHDKRVLIIANDRNRGLAYSLNHCLKYAKGKYIARMDADDISCPNRFEKQLEYLKTHSELAFCGTWASLFDDDGVWGIRKKPEYPQNKDMLFGPPVIHASILILKKYLDAVGGYAVQWDTTRAEDYELFMRLYGLGYKAGNIQEPLYEIREDKEAFRRRSYKYRLQEAHVRLVGFKRLGLYPLGIIYVLKPLIVGLIPQNILKIMRKEKL